MKLFQQLLVAGASLSLIAPIAAQASDVVNLEEMNSYVHSSRKKSSSVAPLPSSLNAYRTEFL